MSKLKKIFHEKIKSSFSNKQSIVKLKKIQALDPMNVSDLNNISFVLHTLDEELNLIYDLLKGEGDEASSTLDHVLNSLLEEFKNS